ncbi:hypothetical protein AAY473_002317 [Plecturocebus cupreus]
MEQGITSCDWPSAGETSPPPESSAGPHWSPQSPGQALTWPSAAVAGPEAHQELVLFDPQSSSLDVLELTCPELDSQDAMVAVLGSGPWWPPGDGKAVLHSASFAHGRGHTPVSITGPSLTISPRLRDPQWPLPHWLAGKRPTVPGTHRAAGDWSLPECPRTDARVPLGSLPRGQAVQAG